MRPTAGPTVLGLAALLLALGSCGDPDVGDETPGATSSPSAIPTDGPTTDRTADPTASPTGSTGRPSDPASLPPDVRTAVDDLAGRTGVDPGEIAVVVFETVTWSDGSIGCPEPGKAYTQALVDGRRLVLAAGGSEFAYHGEGQGPLAYCASPVPPAETAETR
ncbi:hypothetical protein [Georgenia subflava]|uniref:Uncharacterized protein n=1 Tax=Georgenia subflava TaxID=1622177 RepID=A0A6N7EN21_9MICO|nr:hypothetical protein [Georgenia subflava]MPV38528.1 hypothetical protein [Georgenia subflava]